MGLKQFFLRLWRKSPPPPPVAVSPPPATVHFMLTKSMRNDLANLGWTKQEVNGMTPETAAQIITDQRSPSRKPP